MEKRPKNTNWITVPSVPILWWLMAEYEVKVRDELKNHGCWFVRHGNGDHDIWYSPITNTNITVDGKIKSRHTANGIMKQAGIDKHF